MLIIAGSLRVEPATRDAYLSGCGPVIAQARATAGCLDFLLAADPLEPGRIHVYERWESRSSWPRSVAPGRTTRRKRPSSTPTCSAT